MRKQNHQQRLALIAGLLFLASCGMKTEINSELLSEETPENQTYIGSLSQTLTASLISAGLSEEQAQKISDSAKAAAVEGTSSTSTKIMRKIMLKSSPSEDITIVLPLMSKGAVNGLKDGSMGDSAAKVDLVDEVVGSTTELLSGQTDGLSDEEISNLVQESTEQTTTALATVGLSDSDLATATEKASEETTAHLDEAGIAEEKMAEVVQAVSQGAMEGVLNSSVTDEVKVNLAPKVAIGPIKGLSRAKMDTPTKMALPLNNISKGALIAFKEKSFDQEKLALIAKSIAQNSIQTIESISSSSEDIVTLSENVSSGAVSAVSELSSANDSDKAQILDKVSEGAMKGLQNCNMDADKKSSASEKVVQGALNGLQMGSFDKEKIKTFSANVMSGAVKSIDSCAACAQSPTTRDAFLQKIASSGASALNMFNFTASEKAEMMKNISTGAMKGLGSTTLTDDAKAEVAQSISTGAVKGAGALGLTGTELAQTMSKINEGAMLGLDKAISSGSDVGVAAKKAVLGSVIAMKELGLSDEQMTATAKSIASGSALAVTQMTRFSSHVNAPTDAMKNVMSSISQGAMAGAAKVVAPSFLADVASGVAAGTSEGLATAVTDSTAKSTLIDQVKTGATTGVMEEANSTEANAELKSTVLTVTASVESSVTSVATNTSNFQDKYSTSLNNTTIFVPYVKRLELFLPPLIRIFGDMYIVGSCQPGSDVSVSILLPTKAGSAATVKCADTVGVYQVKARDLNLFSDLADGAPFSLSVAQANQVSIVRPFVAYIPATNTTTTTTTIVPPTTITESVPSIKIMGPAANTQVDEYSFAGIACKPGASLSLSLVKNTELGNAVSATCSLSGSFAFKFGSHASFAGLSVNDTFNLKVTQDSLSDQIAYIKRASTIVSNTASTTTIVMKIIEPLGGALIESTTALAGDCSHNMKLAMMSGSMTAPLEQAVTCTSGHFSLTFADVNGFSDLLGGVSFNISMRPEVISGYPPPIMLFKKGSNSTTVTSGSVAINLPEENAVVSASTGLSVGCTAGSNVGLQLSNAAKNFVGPIQSFVCPAAGAMGMPFGNIGGFSMMAPGDIISLTLMVQNSTIKVSKSYSIYLPPASTTTTTTNTSTGSTTTQPIAYNPVFVLPEASAMVQASSQLKMTCTAGASASVVLKTASGMSYGPMGIPCSANNDFSISFGNLPGFLNLAPGVQFQVIVKGNESGAVETTRSFSVYQTTTTNTSGGSTTPPPLNPVFSSPASGSSVQASGQFLLTCGAGATGAITLRSQTGANLSTMNMTCSSANSFSMAFGNLAGFMNLAPGSSFMVAVKGTDSAAIEVSRSFTVYASTSGTNTSTPPITLSATSAAVGQAIFVTFQMKDANGANITVGGAMVTFVVAGGNGMFSNVTDLGNGQYKASFTPSSAGSLQINAMVNGAMITTAPAVLNVQ